MPLYSVKSNMNILMHHVNLKLYQIRYFMQPWGAWRKLSSTVGTGEGNLFLFLPKNPFVIVKPSFFNASLWNCINYSYILRLRLVSIIWRGEERKINFTVKKFGKHYPHQVIKDNNDSNVMLTVYTCDMMWWEWYCTSVAFLPNNSQTNYEKNIK